MVFKVMNKKHALFIRRNVQIITTGVVFQFSIRTGPRFLWLTRQPGTNLSYWRSSINGRRKKPFRCPDSEIVVLLWLIVISRRWSADCRWQHRDRGGSVLATRRPSATRYHRNVARPMASEQIVYLSEFLPGWPASSVFYAFVLCLLVW